MKTETDAAMRFLACLILAASTQASSTVDLVPLGELDATRLRQMAGQPCGPYFASTPTGQHGGLLTFGYTNVDGVKEVAQVVSGMIRPQICKDCDRPTAARRVDGNEEWVHLMISRDDLKMAPCLKSLNTKKHN